MCSMETSSGKVTSQTNKQKENNPKQTAQNKLKLNEINLVGELESGQIIQKRTSYL